MSKKLFSFLGDYGSKKYKVKYPIHSIGQLKLLKSNLGILCCGPSTKGESQDSIKFLNLMSFI